MLLKDQELTECLATPTLIRKKRISVFQKFLEDNGILDELKELGIKEGDTVRMYGQSFEYYN